MARRKARKIPEEILAKRRLGRSKESPGQGKEKDRTFKFATNVAEHRGGVERFEGKKDWGPWSSIQCIMKVKCRWEIGLARVL
jgi:hypothetical protein